MPEGDTIPFAARPLRPVLVREEIASLDHQARRENRQFFLAKILAALVALFTAIASYVRLDEWSKGYYTGWLRLATAGFIGAVGAAAWMWMKHAYELI